MPLLGVVHAVHEVRHPARVGLDAHELELRVALEDATEDEEADDVLAAADDREERVELGPAGLEAVLLLVRMWNDSGSSRSTAAS